VEVVKVHADYASVLLEDGGTVRALADYLGHVDPASRCASTLNLMPAAEGRARAAIDAALGSSAGQMRAKGSRGKPADHQRGSATISATWRYDHGLALPIPACGIRIVRPDP
jgi:hypothetical protein